MKTIGGAIYMYMSDIYANEEDHIEKTEETQKQSDRRA